MNKTKTKISREHLMSIRVNEKLLAGALSKINGGFSKHLMNIKKDIKVNDLIEILLLLAYTDEIDYSKYNESVYTFLNMTSPARQRKEYEEKIKELDYKISKTYGPAKEELTKQKGVYDRLLAKLIRENK